MKDEIETQEASGEVFEELTKGMTSGQIQALNQRVSLMLARLAVEAREEGRGRELPAQELGGPKDALVQRAAGDMFRQLLADKSAGGEGMSLRDVASMYGTSYERVRALAQKLVPDYEEVVKKRRRG